MSLATRYSQVLDARMDLLQFYLSDVGLRVWNKAFYGTNSEGAPLSGDAATQLQAAHYHRFISGLIEGEPVFVQNWIARLLYDNSNKLPLMPFDESMLPFKRGFLWLENSPIQMPVTGKGFHSTLYGVIWQYEQNNRGEISVMLYGVGSAYHPDHRATGDTVAEIIVADIIGKGDTWEPHTNSGYVKAANELYNTRVDTDWYLARVQVVRQIVFSAWNFMQQKIVTVEALPADRPARKRYEKQYNRPAPAVQVIELRRRAAHTAKDSAEQHTVAWNYQWAVSPHPRAQWYPSKQAHERIWIDGYLKGPPDKPLKTADKIFAVVR